MEREESNLEKLCCVWKNMNTEMHLVVEDGKLNKTAFDELLTPHPDSKNVANIEECENYG